MVHEVYYENLQFDLFLATPWTSLLLAPHNYMYNVYELIAASLMAWPSKPGEDLPCH